MSGDVDMPPPHQWVAGRWRCMACGQEWADPCKCPCHGPARTNGSSEES